MTISEGHSGICEGKEKEMLEIKEIKRLIDEDIMSAKKKQAMVGQRYYEAEHDIMNCRLFYYNTDGNLVEDKARTNIKISHPFFTELSDQLSAYMLSFTENPIRAKDQENGLQEHLDEYFDDDFWSEIGEVVTGTYNKGFEYMHAYKNQGTESRTRFECADSIGVIEVEARFASDKQDHILYWYVDKIDAEGKKLKKIMDWTAEETAFYIQTDEGEIEKDAAEKDNPRKHYIYQEGESEELYEDSFGYIPFFRLDYNKKQISGLKPIKGIIDDYDLHACSLSNNLTDFDTPLHVVSGYEGDDLDEVQQNIKTKKIIAVDEGGNVEIRTVEIPYQARKEKLEIDEKNIYRFGFGLNTAGLKDTTATTNIAIKAAYALLDIKANKLTIRLQAFLKKIIKVVLDEINQEFKKGYTVKDVYFAFERTVMTNETENIANAKVEAETRQIEVNTIMNMAVQIGDEQVLKAICEVMDWDLDEIKQKLEEMKEADDLAAAQSALDGVKIDEEDDDVFTE